MKLARFRTNGTTALGLVTDDTVHNLAAADPGLGTDLVAILEREGGLVALRAAAERLGAGAGVPLAEVALEVPIAWPRRIFCLGLNYMDHVGESRFERQAVPTLFVRTPTSLVAAGEAVERPRVSERFDYEAELAVVLGGRLRHADERTALAAVFGYCCFNDGSVRDFQHATPQWTMGKNFDRSGSMGPWIVTADALPAGADGLAIACRLNGQTMQSANTAQMIFKVGETLAFISQAITLLPGDVVAMGTPAGVGHARTPQVFMRAGDTVEIDIEGIGVLANPVADAA